MNNKVGIIFSKDRAMQLDAVLQSLRLHCRDVNKLDVTVLYTTSNQIYEKQYLKLVEEHPYVHFMKEHHFKQQLLSSIASYPFVLFFVDDNLFVKPFVIEDLSESLASHTDALGYSLRLGRNTRYCYSMDRFQNLPNVRPIEKRFLKWNWTAGECDFGYPLEVSSSMYRKSDLIPLLTEANFSNPNTLESELARRAHKFAGLKNCMISHETSISFCNPINKVQQVYNNRAGGNAKYSIIELSRMFEQGNRIDVEKYSGFVPRACHQEVELFFRIL